MMLKKMEAVLVYEDPILGGSKRYDVVSENHGGAMLLRVAEDGKVVFAADLGNVAVVAARRALEALAPILMRGVALPAASASERARAARARCSDPQAPAPEDPMPTPPPVEPPTPEEEEEDPIEAPPFVDGGQLGAPPPPTREQAHAQLVASGLPAAVASMMLDAPGSPFAAAPPPPPSWAEQVVARMTPEERANLERARAEAEMARRMGGRG